MSSSEPLLRVRGLSAAWGGTPVLGTISLDVGDGEYFVLLGPNGSGKTTLLRLLAGLEAPVAGSIELDGREVTRIPAHRRGIGLMFQDPALFPHRTVYENIAYAPWLKRRAAREVDEEVGRLLDLLRLRGFEDRAPTALSGGERQRVALARTLAARPRLVLLDEPFASIDVELRSALRAEFRDVLRATGTAAIHVTHDREEGLFLGDRIGLLFDGRLDAVGPPSTVYAHPTTARAASFLGYNVVLTAEGPQAIHPSDLTLAPDGPGLPVTVTAAGPVGRDFVAVLAGPGGERLEARWTGGPGAAAVGARAVVRWSHAISLRSERAGSPSPLGPQSEEGNA